MEEYIGFIKIFGGKFAPRGWMLCQGQVLYINQYRMLFEIIGNKFGGDGINTFNLPNLQSRVPIGPSNGEHTTYATLGYQGGAETTLLRSENLPNHIHKVPQIPVHGEAIFRIGDDTASNTEANGNVFAQVSAPLENKARPNLYSDKPAFTEHNTLHADSVDLKNLESSAIESESAGNNNPFSIVQPFLTINYIICVEGEMPKPKTNQ